MPLTIRQSSERGYFDYEWLQTYHTFSFGQYYNPNYTSFRSLRVINEDRVKPGVGFPLHSHKDMEILSLVLEGSLAHQDDMGNGSILYPNYVQVMHAGTGITHSEYNASSQEWVHFLQIWILPAQKGLQPSYQKQFFPQEKQHNQWQLIASPDGSFDSLKIYQDVKIYLTTLEPQHSLNQTLTANRFGWLQVLSGSVSLNSQNLQQGDGAAISNMENINIQAHSLSSLLFFDLN